MGRGRELGERGKHVQLGKSCFAHSGGDDLDGGEEGVEQHRKAACGPRALPLLVKHEPRQSHRVGIYVRWGRRDTFSHVLDSDYDMETALAA